MITSRRSFLKQLSAFSAAPFILSSGVWSAATGPNDRITLGFIGTGKQGSYLLDAFLNHKRCQVLAVCDVDTTRRTAAQEKANAFYTARPNRGSADCSAYNDFRELIAREDIDAVVIATPDHWHAFPTVAALKAGKDVYCEKPLTHNIHEVHVVMDTVKETGRVRSEYDAREKITCDSRQTGQTGQFAQKKTA